VRRMVEANGLGSHSLMQSLLRNLQPVLEVAAEELKRRIAETGEVRLKGGMPLPEPFFYHYEVFYYASALLGAIDRLEEAHVYLERFQPAYEEHGITQDQWIDYHYSYYVVTAVSLYDIALVLTNVVFRLGIPPRHCRDSIIKRNRWVRTTPVKAALDELYRQVKPYVELRHLLVHRGEMPKLEQIDLLRLFSFAHRFSDPLVDPRDLKQLYALEVAAVCSGLEIEREQIRQAVRNLFDALLSIYEARAKEAAAIREASV